MTELLNEELIETTYLYCRKRLNSSQDAEDLAQDILLEAMRAIASGRYIAGFYSWYWAMAKNRFNLYLRLKQKGVVALDSVIDTVLSDEYIDSGIIKDEEISELNYQLSRLSEIHRNIVILYYLKEMKISDIARQLDIPEGTVKRRLFDAKNEVRKGMANMTNYGKSSYAPADLNLWGGYSIVKHWNNISDLMTKQIFAACANEAKTIREIADEIGVAPVYFEEKLNYLLEHRFMKESSNGKYLTDFCIYPRYIYNEFNNEVYDVFDGIGKEITDVIASCEDEIRRLDFYGNNFSIGKLLWILYCYAADEMSISMLEIYNKTWKGKIPDNNGKEYRVAGTVSFADEKTVPRCDRERHYLSWSNLHTNFITSAYKQVTHANLYEASPFGKRDSIINDSNADLFMRIFNNPNLGLTVLEEESAAELIKMGYLEKINGGLYPTMPVMSYEIKNKIEALFKKATLNLAEKYVKAVSEVGNRILLPVTRKDLTEEYAHWIMRCGFYPIGQCYYYGGHDDSWILEKPDDFGKSSLGIAIYYS